MCILYFIRKSKKEYLEWKDDCEKWKSQHSNHPNKTLFQNYIDQWQEQDKTLMKVQDDQERKINLIRDELYRRDPGPPPIHFSAEHLLVSNLST